MNQQENATKATVMFYNVENLFPPDPVARKNFNPKFSGLTNWNKERYENKLQKIAKVFDLVKMQYSQLPLLVGLSEVQGKVPLKALLEQPTFENRFEFVLYESLDERGVDVALLYDRTRVEVLESRPLVYFFNIPDSDPENYDTTRDVLYCKIRFQSVVFHLYVLHLPSKRADNINAPKRAFILSDLKKEFERHSTTQEPVLLMGDFNEDPTSGMIQDVLKSQGQKELLRNPFLQLYQSHVFSAYHKRQGLLFDQILLSPQFFEQSALLQFSNAKVFNHAKLATWDRKSSGRPYRTYAGRRYLGGFSDHFPVLIEFKILLNRPQDEDHAN